MLGELREQVVLLEAACNRVLADGQDELVRQALTKAVASFRASPPISAPPFIRGLCHMSAARSEILLSACHEGDIAIIKLEIGKLCGVLRDLRQAIDEALRRVSTLGEWRPMAQFDPSKSALAHDRLNENAFEWKPERYQEHYEKCATPFDLGVIKWDGLLLDGWKPL